MFDVVTRMTSTSERWAKLIAVRESVWSETDAMQQLFQCTVPDGEDAFVDWMRNGKPQGVWAHVVKVCERVRIPQDACVVPREDLAIVFLRGGGG